jgi:gliding motility-associated-like protein
MKKILYLTALLFFQHSFSQNETSNWYFGDKAAIQFDDNNIPNVLSKSKMSTKYGSATISGENGKLLFYTNGSFIYNKKHYKMENGSLLASDSEVLQSSIIIPKPNSATIYYLFTLKNSNAPPKLGPLIPSGLYYSIIDMSLNNGLGTVVEKNTYLNSLVSEKLTAVHASDGESIWVASFGKKKKKSTNYTTFYSYKIDRNGVNSIPIQSELSKELAINKGALKASPDGKYLVLSNYTNAVLANFNSDDGKVEASSLLRIRHGEGMASIGSRPKAYGIEFSQDSKYVYVETVEDGKNIIFQYKTAETNQRSEVYISENYHNFMQLAKDGNIYSTTAESEIKGGNYLSVLIPPKTVKQTVALYNNNSIDLSGKTSRLGLPNFIQSYFRTRILTESGCLNNNTFFKVDTYATITAATWDFGDGNTSNKIAPNYVYTAPGTYIVKATITINNRQISLKKTVTINTNPTANNNQKLIQCDVDNNGIDYFNLNDIHGKITDISLNETLLFYESKQDAEDDKNRISMPNNYQNKRSPQKMHVRVTNKNSCYAITDFSIESVYIQLNNISEMNTCEILKDSNNNAVGSFNLSDKENEIRTQFNLSFQTSLKFYSSLKDAQTKTDELIGNIDSKSTIIWARAEEQNLSCSGMGSIKLTVNQLPILNIDDEYTICIVPSEHPAIILDGNANNNRYNWKDSNEKVISTNRFFTLTNTGSYSLTAYKTENNILCYNTKKFKVINKEPPVINKIRTITNGEKKEIFISITGESSYEFSLDNTAFFGNSNSYTFSNVTPGIHTVYVKDTNDCEPSIKKEVAILGFPLSFTPNNDGINDRWNISGGTEKHFKTVLVHIFNRYGNLLYTINNSNRDYGWDGNSNNGTILPSNDYWYAAILIDNNDNVIKKIGNFSLLRK